MSIQVTWEKENKLLRVDFGQDWDTDGYFQAVARANQMVQQAGGTVDVILNSGLVKRLPDVNIFEVGRKTISMMPRNVGKVAIVDNRLFTRSLMQAFFRVYGAANNIDSTEFIIVDSVGEALEKLS